MTNIYTIVISILVTFFIPLLLSSCSDSLPANDAATTSTTEKIAAVEKQVAELESQVKAKIPELAAHQQVQSPIQTVIVNDETPSLGSTGLTPIKDVEEVTPLLDLTVKRGGTTSYVSMGDNNRIPFIEANFLPPQKIDSKLLTLPTRPENKTSEGGGFEKNEREITYLPLITNHKSLLELQIENLNTFGAKDRSDRVENQKRLLDFKQKVAAQLKLTKHFTKTDIHDMAGKLQVVFQQPYSISSIPPSRHVVFFSDGIDDFNKRPISLPGVNLILVNSSPKAGVFEGVPHQTFRSFKQAIADLAIQIESEKSKNSAK
jgi:hypothetical protein